VRQCASIHRTQIVAAAFTKVFKYIAFVGFAFAVAWGAVHSLEAVAGKVTLADLKASFTLTKPGEGKDGLKDAVNIARLIYDCLALISNLVLFWLYQRARRREKNSISQFGPFRQFYESSIDPMRTSSALNRDGATPAEVNL
jgi:hypothetical protein